MMTKIGSALLPCLGGSLALAVACGGYVPIEKGHYSQHLVPERDFSVEPADAQEIAEATFEELGFEVLSRGEDPLYLRSKVREVGVAVCDCGTVSSLQTRSVGGQANLTLIVELERTGAPGETSVSVEVDCSTYIRLVNGYGMVLSEGRVECASLGTVELDFWEQFESRLANQAP